MTMSEAQRLEQLWSGEFGDAYVDRDPVPTQRARRSGRR